MWITPAHVFEIQLNFTRDTFVMQNTIGLPRFSSSPPLECNMQSTIKRTFHGLSCGLKGKGEEMNECFGTCGANSHDDYGATYNRPNK